MKLYVDHDLFWQKHQPYRLIKESLQPVFHLTVVGVIGSCALNHAEHSPMKPRLTELHDMPLTSPACHFH